MSRTRKGSKSPGFEQWGKRRGSGLTPGKAGKRIYTQMERADAKIEVLKAPREPEYDPREYVPNEGEDDERKSGAW